jgi:hypothetical protein
VTGRYPTLEFEQSLAAVKKAMVRERRVASDSEFAEVRAAWEFWNRSAEWDARHPSGWHVGTRPPEWNDVEAELLTIPREAQEAEWLELQVAEAKQRQANERRRGPEREPLPVLDVTEAVRLKVTKDATYEEIEAATGLSPRKVSYIMKALRHRPVPDLSWDGSLRLGPETRNTSEGLILPAR